VQLNDKTATGIEVPAEVVAGLGQGQRPPVRVTIGDYSYRTTVARMGGQFLISLSAENRAAAGVAAGDEVDVDLELDDAPREVEVPADLAAALARDDAARAAFDSLARIGCLASDAYATTPLWTRGAVILSPGILATVTNHTSPVSTAACGPPNR